MSFGKLLKYLSSVFNTIWAKILINLAFWQIAYLVVKLIIAMYEIDSCSYFTEGLIADVTYTNYLPNVPLLQYHWMLQHA